MRELTKSMTSLTWALSVFGVRQMAAFLSPDAARAATSSFDRVTRCAEEQLDSFSARTFRAGDNLQRGFVDLLFSTVTLEVLDPNRVMGLGIDILQRGVNAAYELTAAPTHPAPGQSGWGPVPTPRA